MATDQNPGFLVRTYSNNIGEPITADEAYGYWLFVLGGILGVAGIGTFLFSEAAGTVRETAITMAALGLVLLLLGPVVRLPLKRVATYLAFVGAIVSAAGVAWFTVAYPAEWFTAGGQSQQVIAVYGAGVGLIGLAAVVVPLLTEPAEERERLQAAVREGGRERERLERERDELRDERDELRQVRDELREERDDRGDQIRDLEDRLDASRDAGASLERDLDDVRAELAALRESTARFELYRDRSDGHRWRLRHENGNILATSSRSHTSRRTTQQRIQGVRRHALGADLVRIDPVEPAPEAMAEDTDPLEAESRAAFEVYEDAAGEHRWRLRHRNGNVLADSGEGYGSRRDARRGLESARTAAGEAVYLRADPTAFEMFRDRAGEYRWRLVHRNGNVLADGGQGYASRSGARDGIESVRRNVDGARAEFETYEDAAGEWRWRLVHRNGNVIADGGQGYDSQRGVEEAVERVREYAPDANALDIGHAAFEVFEDDAGEWRWRLRHRNGNVLADGGQGYDSRSGGHEGIDGVKRNAPAAEVVDAEKGDGDAEPDEGGGEAEVSE